MAAILNISVDVDKLRENRFYVTQAGRRYANLTVTINDEPNQYGKQINVSEDQKKEERDAKEKKNFVGQGKIVWTNGIIRKAEAPAQPQGGGYSSPPRNGNGYGQKKWNDKAGPANMDEPPF